MNRDYIGIGAFVLAVFGFLASHYRTKGMAEVIERLTKIETKVEIYFELQERYNAAILHRPTHKDVDHLLETRERGELLSEDADKELDEALERIINDKNQTVGFRAAAAQMLAVRKARNECS